MQHKNHKKKSKKLAIKEAMDGMNKTSWDMGWGKAKMKKVKMKNKKSY